jgi:hypothetical protein
MYDDSFEGGFLCGAAPDPSLGMIGFILRVDADEDNDVLTYSHQDVVVTSLMVKNTGDVVEMYFTVVEFSSENPVVRNLGGPTTCLQHGEVDFNVDDTAPLTL